MRITLDVTGLGTVFLSAGIGAIGGVIGASGIHMAAQAVASGLLSAANNIGTATLQGQKVNWFDVGLDALIGAGSSLIGSFAMKKVSDVANKVVKKGINCVVSGINKFKNGSRYWQSTVKRGLYLIRQGVKDLNIARGKASVIGSGVSGAFSTIKTGIYALME